MWCVHVTPNQPNCSDEPGGSNSYYLTHLYGVDSRFGGDQDEGSNMPDVIDWMSPFVYRSRGGWLMHTCMKALVVILSNKGLLL